MAMQGKTLLGFAVIGGCAIIAAGCSRAEKTAAEAPTDAASAATTPPADISIPGTGIFPESLTSSADGTIYIGSVGKGEVYRVAPGTAAAEPFIAPGTGGIKQVFGVLADDATGTLWACSNDLGGGAPGRGAAGPSALHSFDLATGTPKANLALPTGGFCNDIAVGPGGDVYISDTNGMQVLRLAKGGTALESWSAAGSFGPPGGVLDGIAVVGNRVVVNTLMTSKLFAVEVGADGKAGAVKELQLSSPLTRPDGMRAWGESGLLSTDGSGKIQQVAINGDAATLTTVKDGLDGVVAVTVVGKTAYALEGQLGIMMAPAGTTPPAEKPYRAVAFTLP
jgi:sugar lactone lactonase YvrE